MSLSQGVALVILAYAALFYCAASADAVKEKYPHLFDKHGVYQGNWQCPIPPSETPQTFNVVVHGRHGSGRVSMLNTIVQKHRTNDPNWQVGHCDVYSSHLATNVLFNFIDATGFHTDTCRNHELRLTSMDKTVEELFKISQTNQADVHRLYYVLNGPDQYWQPNIDDVVNNLKAIRYVYGDDIVSDIVFIIHKCQQYGAQDHQQLREICQHSYRALYGIMASKLRILFADNREGMYQVWEDLAEIAADPKPHHLCRGQVGSSANELARIKTKIFNLDLYLKYERDTMIEIKRRYLQQAQENITRLMRFSETIDAALETGEPLHKMILFPGAAGSVRIDGKIVDFSTSKVGIILAPNAVLAHNPVGDAPKDNELIVVKTRPFTFQDYLNRLHPRDSINPQCAPERHMQNYKLACLVEETNALKNLVMDWIEANRRVAEQCERFLTAEDRGESSQRLAKYKAELKEILQLAGQITAEDELLMDTMLHFPNCQCHICSGYEVF